MDVIDLDKARAVRVLGRGAMGTVFLVADPASPSAPYALKVFEKRSPAVKPNADRRARWEVSVLSRLAHPHLPSLLASTETPELLAWAVPYCAGGDLNALRYSLPDRVFSPAAIRFYIAETVSALAELHSLGIVYRDLKPENVLLRADGHVTLTDFDLSRLLPPKSPSTSSSSSSTYSPPPQLHNRRRHHHRHRRNLTRIFFGSGAAKAGEDQLKKAKSARVSPVSRRRTSICSSTSGGGGGSSEKSFSFVGTEEYVSPEVVRGEGHEFAVDWWAVGVLTYEMAYGTTPFRGRNRKETFRNVLLREPEFPGRQRSDLTDLISRLLAKEPVKRLGFAGGADEVRAHPFFAGVNWDLVEEVSRPPYIPPPAEDVSPDIVCDGFDVRDYFKLLHQLPEPSPVHTSLPEF